MSATDAMIRRFETEFEERSTFVQGLIAGANEKGRDLSGQELELISGARGRMDELRGQLEPLYHTAQIAAESRAKAKEIDEAISAARNYGKISGPVEYRSAGAYIADVYLTAMGSDESRTRLEVFNRAAAHQTTADNPGLLPERIVEPVLNRVDSSRPLVTAIGPTDLGTGSWAYARVTQHTLVGAQSAEKAELPSRKMTITKTSITAPTLGGYVNVSKQDINRTSPQILDMVVNDLASEYSIETEEAAAADLLAAATAGTALDATPSAEEVNAALWAAVATAYGAVRGGGRVILGVAAADLGKFASLFAPVNPSNALSSGFSAADFGSGVMGSISGIPVIMSPGMTAGQALVINTAGVRIWEMRYGALQVNEPSVWGVQVGYAGDFDTLVLDAGSVVSIDTAP